MAETGGDNKPDSRKAIVSKPVVIPTIESLQKSPLSSPNLLRLTLAERFGVDEFTGQAFDPETGKPVTPNTDLEAKIKADYTIFLAQIETERYFTNHNWDDLPIYNTETGEKLSGVEKVISYEREIKKKLVNIEEEIIFLPLIDPKTKEVLIPGSLRQLKAAQAVKARGGWSPVEYQELQQLAFAAEKVPETSASNSSLTPEKEIEQILQLPADQRVTALEQVRQRMVVSSLGIARLTRRLIQDIRFTPDADLGSLLEIAFMYRDKYNISKNEMDSISWRLSKFTAKQETIKHELQSFPDGKTFCQVNWGFEPQGELEFTRGRVGVILYCKNERDYINAYYKMDLAKASDDPQKIAKWESAVKKTGAVFIAQASKIFPYPVILCGPGGLAAVPHEEQHLLDNIIGSEGQPKAEDYAKVNGAYLEKELSTAVSDQDKEKVMDAFMWRNINLFVGNIKTEILAFSKEGLQPKTIENTLITHDSYDYLANLWNYLFSRNPQYEALAKSSIKRVLVDEYRAFIKRSVGYVDQLIGAGLSRDEAIVFLSTKRFNRWGREVKRLVTMTSPEDLAIAA